MISAIDLLVCNFTFICMIEYLNEYLLLDVVCSGTYIIKSLLRRCGRTEAETIGTAGRACGAMRAIGTDGNIIGGYISAPCIKSDFPYYIGRDDWRPNVDTSSSSIRRKSDLYSPRLSKRNLQKSLRYSVSLPDHKISSRLQTVSPIPSRNVLE